MVKFFIKPYNKRAESKDDLRYAVIRQEGSSKRILQQEFLTEEGANDWLKQYHLKKEKKQGYNPTKSAEHRRNLARMHDSRRIQTAMPPPSTQDMTRSQYANVKVPKPPSCLVVAGISLTSVHADPFQDSTFVEFADISPPTTIPAVDVPNPAPLILAVFTSAISVQDEPFQDSVLRLPVDVPGS